MTIRTAHKSSKSVKKTQSSSRAKNEKKQKKRLEKRRNTTGHVRFDFFFIFVKKNISYDDGLL